ncbi:MAG: RNA polymerase sigma factor [Gammaproteobacteria bacterium]|nr:MAG: RNA polymerase sigma factor [Gammaproteobacteria bacterium]
MDATAKTNWLEEMDKLQKGDRLALIKVTRVITGYLTRYRAYEIRDSWDDLCQEVLMALINSIQKQQIQHENAFISYLGIITRNKLADWIHHRHRAGSDNFLGDQDTANAILDKVSIDDSHQQQDDMLDLNKALEALPERERKVINEIYIQGHSYEDAAQRLDMPLGTLKRLQTQGLKLLREKMQLSGPNSLSDLSNAADLSMTAAALQTQTDSG